METPPTLPAPSVLNPKLRYRLTRADVIRASLRALTFNRSLMTYVGLFTAVMVGLAVKDAADEGKSIGYMIALTFVEVGLIALVMIAGMTIVTTLTLLFSKGHGVVCEHELEITDAGLIERTEYNESLHRWKGVTGVRETSAFFFIRVNESGGSMHVIPKRSAPVAGDLPAFIAEVRHRISGA